MPFPIHSRILQYIRPAVNDRIHQPVSLIQFNIKTVAVIRWSCACLVLAGKNAGIRLRLRSFGIICLSHHVRISIQCFLANLAFLILTL